MPGRLKRFFYILCVMAVCFFTGKPISAQTLRNTYRFYNSLSTIERDCGPDLTPAEGLNKICKLQTAATSGQYVTDSFPAFHLTRTVYQNNLNWGLEYLNDQGIIEKTYTIQMYIRVFNFNKFYTRIIDFSEGKEDNGIYFTDYQTPGPPNLRCLNFFPQGNYGPCPFFRNDTYYLLTLTRNDTTKQIYVYVNDQLFTSYRDNDDFYTSAKGKPIYVFRDDPVGFACEDGQADFAYLSFANLFSSREDVDAIYKDIGKVIGPDIITSSTDTVCAKNKVTVFYKPDSSTYSPNNRYTWDWADGNATLQPDSSYDVSWNLPGKKTIRLTVTGGVCQHTFSYTKDIQVDSLIPPQLADTYTLCEGDTIDLFPGSYSSYQWQDGSSQGHFLATTEGRYSVTVSNSCLTATAQTFVKETRCYLVFPSAFTPNNDNLNDNFRQLELFDCVAYQLQIYNRYGQVVFESHSPYDNWNGIFKGVKQPAGIYIWSCSYRRTLQDKENRLHGTVAILK